MVSVWGLKLWGLKLGLLAHVLEFEFNSDFKKLKPG